MNYYERQNLLELLKIRMDLAILKKEDEQVKEIENEIIAVQRGYTDFYVLGGNELSDEKDQYWFEFIYDVLTIYSRMINSVECNQGGAHKHIVNDVKFPGFDGNNELDEMEFVEFFIVKIGRFGEIETINNGEYNSHREMIPTYKRMVSQFKQMGEPVIMSDEQIDCLLNC